MKFVSQILQQAVTFFSETLYCRYSCIRSVFLTHSFNWLHVCDKMHVVCHLRAINWNYVWEIFSVSIFLNIPVNFMCTYACGEGYPGNQHRSQMIFRLWQWRKCKQEKHCYKAVNNNVSQSESKW